MVDIFVGDYTFRGFTSLEAADEHLAGDIARSTTWFLKSEDTKGRGLVSASRLIATLPFCDTPPDPAAALEDVPEVLRAVTAELAADLVAKPRLAANPGGNSNIKVAKAGSAQVEFFAAVEGGPPIPAALYDRLVAARLVCGRTGGSDDDGSLSGALVSGISAGDRPLDGRYSDYCRDGWLARDRD